MFHTESTVSTQDTARPVIFKMHGQSGCKVHMHILRSCIKAGGEIWTIRIKPIEGGPGESRDGVFNGIQQPSTKSIIRTIVYCPDASFVSQPVEHKERKAAQPHLIESTRQQRGMRAPQAVDINACVCSAIGTVIIECVDIVVELFLRLASRVGHQRGPG